MPNENEETKVLYDLSDLSNEEEQNNQIFEVNNTTNLENNPMEEVPKTEGYLTNPPKKKFKAKIKDWWKKRTKKQRIGLIILLCLVIILIAVGIFFLVKEITKKPVVEPVEVIVQEENYRYENGTLIFLNSEKEELGRYTCKNQSEKLCFVSYYSNEDNFDTEKKVYENNAKIKVRSAIINDEYVFINDNAREADDTTILYNIKEEKEEGNYNLVKKGGKDQYILKNKEGNYGLVDFSGATFAPKINFTKEYLGYINNDTNDYVALENNKQVLVDENGNNISKPFAGKIKNFNKTYVKVQQNAGKYEVYDYNGSNIFNESFDYIELYNDFAALLNGKELNLKFYDTNKLNEEAILLNNLDYVKTSVYDEKNKLINKKEAFSIEENNDIITITIVNGDSTTTTTVNKAEGTISKNLKNINYFNGKLYIYRDANKKDLLGTYTCANKNNINSSTTSLSNCSLAQDTIFEDNDYEVPGVVGAIPIFNERFVFVNDNPDLVNDANKTIVLYDLKNNNSLGKYAAVNTYSYTGSNEISFSTVNDLQVVAKNKSGKFGVIKVGLSEVSGHIGFNYTEMEALHDYYVAKDANGYLLLSKANGASITSAIPYKIRNYNEEYVKVINNNSYYIYDFKGKQINNDGYKYIELYKDFFAGVSNNNVLGLYTYDAPRNSFLTNDDIRLNLTNYYGNGTLAFVVNVTGNRYTVLVGTTENNYQDIGVSGFVPVSER